MSYFKDLGLDEDGDLNMEFGDLKVELSDDCHIEDIIKSYPGYWKQYPLCGVGIEYYLNSSGLQQQIKNEIKSALKADGYIVNSLTIDNDGNIKLDCER